MRDRAGPVPRRAGITQGWSKLVQVLEKGKKLKVLRKPKPDEQITKPGSSSLEPKWQQALAKPIFFSFTGNCGVSLPGFKSWFYFL